MITVEVPTLYTRSDEFYKHVRILTCTVKKKGPRGVGFEGCYSPGSVMATHKGVELTSWGVGRLR